MEYILALDVIWEICREIQKRNGNPFGKTHKVRVACSVQKGETFYGKNIASKAKSEKKMIFHSCLLSALKQSMQNFEVQEQEPPIKIKNLYFGTCAEDDAANKLLNRHSEIILKDIFFSIALNPITFQRVPYCAVCCDIFNVSNNV